MSVNSSGNLEFKSYIEELFLLLFFLAGFQRLDVLVKSLLLRRTKDQIQTSAIVMIVLVTIFCIWSLRLIIFACLN